MARAKQERPPDPDRLVRRSAGDLHTEDGRFEVSSTGGAGRWYVTDTERHDGLGLALVLGPFGTLDEVRAAIGEQRSAPAGDDGPLPEPTAPVDSAPGGRARRGTHARREPEAEPEPELEREPEPEPDPEPPPRPPVRITRARWRARHDERDTALDLVRRVTDGWLTGEVDEVRDALHEACVVQPPRPAPALVGRAAVSDAWRTAATDAPATTFSEREPSVDVMGASAVVRYRYELDREVDGEPTNEQGDELWVLTRVGDRWLVAFRMTLSDDPSTGHRS